jgi:MinD superfamily P-loop ATPase
MVMRVAVASGKGGTGKTTLAVNLADMLAERGKVVLADLDAEEPNSALFINGRLYSREDRFRSVPRYEVEKCTLCGLCTDLCNFNALIRIADEIMVFPRLCHSCYACSELCPAAALPMDRVKIGELTHLRAGNLDFVECRLLVGEEQAVPLISQAYEYIGGNFGDDIPVIIDSPPGTSCPMIEAVKEADLVILVTEPTPFGLHDLRLAVETAEKLQRKHAVVINRYGIGNDDVIEYCRVRGIDIAATIPDQREAARLYSEGKLINGIAEVREELQKIIRFIDRAAGRKVD